MWHVQDSQRQVLALAFRSEVLEILELSPLRSSADDGQALESKGVSHTTVPHATCVRRSPCAHRNLLSYASNPEFKICVGLHCRVVFRCWIAGLYSTRYAVLGALKGYLAHKKQKLPWTLQ